MNKPSRRAWVDVYGYQVAVTGFTEHGDGIQVHLDDFDLLFALDSVQPQPGDENPTQDKPRQKRPKSDPGE